MSKSDDKSKPQPSPQPPPNSVPVWKGKPSVGPYIIFRGILALIAFGIIGILEYYYSTTGSLGRTIFPSSVKLIGITLPYPVELATAIIILIIFIASSLRLVSLWATNRYELFTDGLYVNMGILNLENSYLSPMAFSDARLFRSWEMRLIHRGQIIVEANDERKFYLHIIKNPVQVQYLIRETLGHPTVRTGP